MGLIIWGNSTNRGHYDLSHKLVEYHDMLVSTVVGSVSKDVSEYDLLVVGSLIISQNFSFDSKYSPNSLALAKICLDSKSTIVLTNS